VLQARGGEAFARGLDLHAAVRHRGRGGRRQFHVGGDERASLGASARRALVQQTLSGPSIERGGEIAADRGAQPPERGVDERLKILRGKQREQLLRVDGTS